MKHPETRARDWMVLVINPGSTSTKVALFRGETKEWTESVRHAQETLVRFRRVIEQLDWREAAIAEALTGRSGEASKPDAVVGRGGLLRPLAGGTYRVSDAMCADLEAARYGEHASNLGALLARRFAERYGAPAFIVDPVTTDEFEPASRITGVPGFERKCRSHALNIKAVGRRAAWELGKPLAETKFVVAHLGGGISVCALRGGRIADSTDALLGEGPFSTERAGTLPLAAMIRLCLDSGKTREEIVELLAKGSGLKGYLGQTDLPAVYEMIDAGNGEARRVLDALVLQVAKWIGAMTAVLGGSPDAIVLSGGMVNSARLVHEIRQYVGLLAPLRIYPGEFEMEALAAGAVRVLEGAEAAREY